MLKENKFNRILIDDVKYAYPDNTLPPQFVQDKLSEFVEGANEISKNPKKGNPENINLILNILFGDTKLKSQIKFPFSKKNKSIGTIIKLLEEKYNDRDFMWYYYIFYYIGFYFSTIKPSAFSPESLVLPKKFKQQKNDLIASHKNGNIDDIMFQEKITELAQEVVGYLNDENVPLMDFINSGAKGETRNMQEILVGIGLSINSKGEIIDVIDSSLSEGLTQTQFFNNSSQGIQTLYAKSSETAKPGYLGRKIETLTEGIKLSKIKDCMSTKYLKVNIKTKDVLGSIQNRNTKQGKKITNDSKLIGKTVELRSPLYCLATDGICEKCYNSDFVQKMELESGANIGLIASTGLLGQLVNLTLKGSHLGVSLNQEKIDFTKDIKDYM